MLILYNKNPWWSLKLLTFSYKRQLTKLANAQFLPQGTLMITQIAHFFIQETIDKFSNAQLVHQETTDKS